MRLLLILNDNHKSEIEILEGNSCLHSLAAFKTSVAERLKIPQPISLMIFNPFWNDFVNFDDVSKLQDKAKIKVI